MTMLLDSRRGLNDSRRGDISRGEDLLPRSKRPHSIQYIHYQVNDNGVKNVHTSTREEYCSLSFPSRLYSLFVEEMRDKLVFPGIPNLCFFRSRAVVIPVA